ncbi:MAG: glycosyltransferase family 10 [Rickettsiales bacterium]
MKRKILIIFAIIILIFGYRYRTFIPAFYYENFVKYENNLPKKGGEFVVRAEHVRLGNFVVNVIKLAFPEYKVIVSDTKKPNLVVRSIYRARNSFVDQLKNRAPYIAMSAEKKPLKYRRYRVTGYPFFEFTTNLSLAKNHAYVPLAAYHKDDIKFLNSLPRKKPSLESIKERRNVAYMFRHCTSNREEVFKALHDAFPKVDALGKCSKTTSTDLPKNAINTYNKYKFVISMENGFAPGYITEKIINAYEAGAIPIYWGDSQTTSKYFNKKSYIDVSDFKDMRALTEYIDKLLSNPKEMQRIMSEPVLTKEGEGMLNVNASKLSPESKRILSVYAKQLRHYYFAQLNQKTLPEKLFG